MPSNKKLKLGIQTYTCEGVYLNGEQLTEPTGIYLDGEKTLFWEPEADAFYFIPVSRENLLLDSATPVSGYLANASYPSESVIIPQKVFEGWTKDNVSPYSGVLGAVRMVCAINSFRLGDVTTDTNLLTATESEAPFNYPIENTPDTSVVGNLSAIVQDYGGGALNIEQKPVFVNTLPNTFSLDNYSGIILPEDVPFSGVNNTYMCFWNDDTIHGKLPVGSRLYAMSYDPYALAYVAGYNFQGNDITNMTILIRDVSSEEQGKAQANAILKGLYDSFGDFVLGVTVRVIITNANTVDWEAVFGEAMMSGKSLFSENLITNSPIAMPLVNNGINTCAYYACFPEANKYTYFINDYANGVAAVGPAAWGAELSDDNYQLSNLYIYHYLPTIIGYFGLAYAVSGAEPDESHMFMSPSNGGNVCCTHTLDPKNSGVECGYEAIDVGTQTTDHSISKGELSYVSNYTDTSNEYGIVPTSQSNLFIGNSTPDVNGLFSPGGPGSVELYITLESGSGTNDALKYLWN